MAPLESSCDQFLMCFCWLKLPSGRFIVTRITPQGCRAVLSAPRKRAQFALLSPSLRSSVIVAGIAYGPVPVSPSTSPRAFEWPGGLRTFGACQCFVGCIMSFQGTQLDSQASRHSTPPSVSVSQKHVQASRRSSWGIALPGIVPEEQLLAQAI